MRPFATLIIGLLAVAGAQLGFAVSSRQSAPPRPQWCDTEKIIDWATKPDADGIMHNRIVATVEVPCPG